MRYFGVEQYKTRMTSSNSSAPENKSFSSPSVSPFTDDSHSNAGNEGVVFRAQFKSCEPMSSSGGMPSILLAKRGILEALRKSSSIDTSKVSFSPLRDGRLSIDTTCCIIADILRAVPYLEQTNRPQFRGVCYLEASQGCSEAELLEEVQQGNANIGIIKLDRMKGNNVIITFASSLPPAIFYFSARCEVKPYYSSPFRCRKCQAFGHLHTQCKQTARCGNCSQIGHFAACCTNAANCRTCKAPHRPDSVRCPRWQQEIRIKKCMATTGLTYRLAKQAINVSSPRISAVSSASPSSQQKPPSLKPTWAKVAAKSVGTMRPRSVATQTKSVSR